MAIRQNYEPIAIIQMSIWHHEWNQIVHLCGCPFSIANLL
jgi:hypothetical protein